jgi:molybdopterin/thiamine biosynthesis adenylyltransferase/rhodanese-related sulfurtransferase
MDNRYNRHIILKEIGQSGQDKLLNAKVLMVGAGGLGCPILQYLASAGVGTIGVIDDDVVELTNLQRQILFGKSSLGKNKAEAAKRRLLDLNDSISIHAYPEKLTYQNAIELFNQYDIIVDGTDNFETRYLINDTCIITNKPLVFGAIYKFQGQVSVFNYKNGPSYRCAFPNKPKGDAVPNCSEIGVLGVLPGIIGTIQANEVLKIILSIGDVLSGKLYCYDALSNKATLLSLKRSEDTIRSILLIKDDFEKNDLETSCQFNVNEISIVDVLGNKNVQIIDIREHHEQPKVSKTHVLEIPLSELDRHIDKLDKTKQIAIFCNSGIRSKTAVSKLMRHNILNCFSIREGASQINNYLNDSIKPVINE